ncbi:MAG TPA: hypothetical protein VLZ75_07375 [Chitinophagales bacterium]|nr:hypothetical protein [Chitinophagales bacterium]
MKKLLDFIKAMFIIIPLFCLLVFFVTRKNDAQGKKIYEGQNYTYGEIKYVGKNKSYYALFEYDINGRVYRSKYPTASYYKSGECYLVYYDSLKPENIYVDYTIMKFPNTVKEEYTIATVTNIKGKQFVLRPNNELTYEFFYDGNRYERTQEITEDNIEAISIGDNIKVVFNANKPESSLLDMENL